MGTSKKSLECPLALDTPAFGASFSAGDGSRTYFGMSRAWSRALPWNVRLNVGLDAVGIAASIASPGLWLGER